MSAAAADAAPVKKGLPKKLLIIVIALVVLLAAGGGAAVFMMKKKQAEAAAAAEEEDDGDGHAAAASHDSHKSPPTYVPLDPFTVNLADRDAERFAQIGITLQLDDPKVGDELKTYMPSVRNSLLMVLAHKSSAELLERDGKSKLASEIALETARAMGYDVEDPDAEAAADDDSHGKSKKKKKKKSVDNPISHVLFSSFIIQ